MSHQYINSIKVMEKNVDEEKDRKPSPGVSLQYTDIAQSEGTTRPMLLGRGFQLSSNQ